MVLRDYLEPICYKEYEKIEGLEVKEVANFMKKCGSYTFYIVKDNKPIYIFTTTDILEIIIKNLECIKISDYMSKYPKTLKSLKISTHILDVYNYMRSNRLKYVPIIDDNNELVGEVAFKTLSLKIADIAIKDSLTGLYNKKYFDVLLKEFNEFNKPLGIIYIEFLNLDIIEDFYSPDFAKALLKLYARTIKQCVRDIDFVFRIEKRFKILTFNDLEDTDKIAKRINKKLEETSFNDVKAAFKIVLSQVPELEDNILMAIESCEKRLIERN
ncbi:MAG: diguanylate cyclase [Nautiliaceae bacterium]